MKLAQRKIKCPLCGAANAPEAHRCTVCTRPLQDAPLASQRVYDEAMWSEKIASKESREPINKFFVLACLLVAAGVLNYFVVKAGPDWAHQTAVSGRGESWRTTDAGSGVKVDLPGRPVRTNGSMNGQPAAQMSVWVDGSWESVRDENTNSKAALDRSLDSMHAAIFVSVSANAVDAPAISDLVTQLAPESVIDASSVVPIEAPTNTLAWKWESAATGWPRANVEGMAYGRAIRRGDVTAVVVTIVRHDDGGALLSAVMDNLSLPTP